MVKHPVLVSAGIELILFLVAGAVLCCGLGVRIMLITHWWFSCGWVMFILSQGLFSGPARERAGGAQETGRGHSQDSWPESAKGTFHTIEHHAEYIMLGDWLGIGQCMVGSCIVHHLGWFSLPFGFCPFPLLSPFHYNCYYYYFILFQLLNCSYLSPWILPFSQFSSPSLCGRTEWVSSFTVLSCWLGLNQNNSVCKE